MRGQGRAPEPGSGSGPVEIFTADPGRLGVLRPPTLLGPDSGTSGEGKSRAPPKERDEPRIVRVGDVTWYRISIPDPTKDERISKRKIRGWAVGRGWWEVRGGPGQGSCKRIRGRLGCRQSGGRALSEAGLAKWAYRELGTTFGSLYGGARAGLDQSERARDLGGARARGTDGNSRGRSR